MIFRDSADRGVAPRCSVVGCAFSDRRWDAAWLVLLTGIAHFLHSRGFGLYEDDYVYIATSLDANLSSVRDIAARALIEWPQGRPLQSVLPPLLTVLLFPLGGLLPLYVVGFVVTALTVLAFYRLAQNVTGSRSAALFAAIMFCLFPADTTHPFLTHALVLRVALLCSLAACWFHLSRRVVGAYALAFLGLMFYETPFLIFLGFPMLTASWSTSAGRKELLRHAFTCVGLIAVTVIWRWFNGEERLAAARSGFGDILIQLPQQMALGAAVAIRQMTYGPVKRIGGWDGASLALIVPAAVLFYLWLRAALGAEARGLRSGADSDASSAAGWWLTGRAAALLLVAYLLSFTHEAWIIYGRLTSVHLAAAAGGSLMFGLLAHRLTVNPEHRPRRWALPLLALHLAVLLGYRHTIQVDFARSWQLQQWYWSEVLEQTPDLTDGTVVLVDGRNMPATRYIRTYSWCDPLMLALLFRIPGSWQQPPVALPLFENARITVDHDGLGADFPDLPARYPFRPGKVVLLEALNGQLRRSRAESAELQGVRVPLQSAVGSPAGLEIRPLYRLIRSGDESALSGPHYR